MLKKIKNKICEIICKVFKIKPCVCDHECNCKKEKQIMEKKEKDYLDTKEGKDFLKEQRQKSR
jgi:hypothetical protein